MTLAVETLLNEVLVKSKGTMVKWIEHLAQETEHALHKANAHGSTYLCRNPNQATA